MNDRSTIRIVAASLAALALAGLGSATWLLTVGVDASSVAIISGLTGTCIGGLSSLLASTKTGDGQP